MSELSQPTDSRKAAATRGAWKLLSVGLAFTLIRATAAMAADGATTLAPDLNLDVVRPPVPLHGALPPAPFAPQSFSRSSGANLADPAVGAARNENLGLPAALLPVPGDYSLPPAAEPHAFSGNDFRPRAHSVFETNPGGDVPRDNLMVDKTVWQRLQEYRTRDRVRVMTLWESGASNLSIQTNRRGAPSLQWTSRLMNRGGATRGLLDRWSPASMFHSFSRSTGAAAGKSANAIAEPHAGMSAIP